MLDSFFILQFLLFFYLKSIMLILLALNAWLFQHFRFIERVYNFIRNSFYQSINHFCLPHYDFLTFENLNLNMPIINCEINFINTPCLSDIIINHGVSKFISKNFKTFFNYVQNVSLSFFNNIFDYSSSFLIPSLDIFHMAL